MTQQEFCTGFLFSHDKPYCPAYGFRVITLVSLSLKVFVTKKKMKT